MTIRGTATEAYKAGAIGYIAVSKWVHSGSIKPKFGKDMI